MSDSSLVGDTLPRPALRDDAERHQRRAVEGEEYAEGRADDLEGPLQTRLAELGFVHHVAGVAVRGQRRVPVALAVARRSR